jgi:hypothetical protein
VCGKSEVCRKWDGIRDVPSSGIPEQLRFTSCLSIKTYESGFFAASKSLKHGGFALEM